ncbi:MAG: LemA family protein [Planctomycetota bacterium]
MLHLLTLIAADTPAAAPPATAASAGMGPMMILLIVGGVVLLGIILFVAMYNALVALRNRVKESWAQIEVQLKRRYDLIPNLVETVKGYQKHEEGTLTKVIEARNHALAALKALSGGSGMNAGIPVASGAAASGMPAPMGGGGASSGFGALMQAEGVLQGALKGLNVTFEQYPDLKANENFLRLQDELSSTEDRIAFARQHYNDEVRRYNTKRETIPTNIVASMGGFQAAAFFEISETERQNVKVAF